jgi:hypothetical protein
MCKVARRARSGGNDVHSTPHFHVNIAQKAEGSGGVEGDLMCRGRTFSLTDRILSVPSVTCERMKGKVPVPNNRLSHEHRDAALARERDVNVPLDGPVTGGCGAIDKRYTAVHWCWVSVVPTSAAVRLAACSAVRLAACSAVRLAPEFSIRIHAVRAATFLQ